MDGLAQVNLMVGKNNSGKTALLEAIQFLASGGEPTVLEEIATRRGEFVMSRTGRPLVDPSHFFHGHVLKPDYSISIAGDNGHKPVQIKVVTAKPRRVESGDEDAGLRVQYSSAVMKIEGGTPVEKDERVFRMTRDGGVDLEVSARSRRLGLFGKEDGPFVRFIGAESLDVRQLATMSDEIKVRRLTDQVVGALRILDDDVRVFDFLTGMMGYSQYLSRAGAVIGRRDERALIPLGSMGDGMRRMLALASSLACTNDGSLCADEIDTGLHYSVMSKMWKLVVEQACNCNVQVFATTHSWDCIEGLSLLCQLEPQWLDKVAIHAIDRTLERSVLFKGDSIVRMAKHQIDPR